MPTSHASGVDAIGDGQVDDVGVPGLIAAAEPGGRIQVGPQVGAAAAEDRPPDQFGLGLLVEASPLRHGSCRTPCACVGEEALAEMKVLVGFDDELAAEVTRLHGLLTPGPSRVGTRARPWRETGGPGRFPASARRVYTSACALSAEAGAVVTASVDLRTLAGPAGLASDLDLGHTLDDLGLYVAQLNTDAEATRLGGCW